MPEPERAAVVLRTADGTAFKIWDEFEARESFLDPLGSYSFKVRPPRDKIPLVLAALKPGELVGVSIAERPLATPIITSQDLQVSREGVQFDLECKSTLCTPYEGSVDPDACKSLPTDVPVLSLILAAMAPYGLDEVQANARENVNARTGKPIDGRGADVVIQELTAKDIQAQSGESAYGYCARIFRRLGVVLHVDCYGVLLLTRPDYAQAAAYTIVQDFGERTVSGDRPLSMRWHRSNDGLYSEVVVRGLAADSGKQTTCKPPGARVGATEVGRPVDAACSYVPFTATAGGLWKYASTSMPYKPLFRADKQARDVKWAKNSALVYYSRGLAEAYWCEVELAGFLSRSTGRTWTPDTVCRVVCAQLGIDEDMWILERSFSQSRGGGQRTRLKLLQLGALQISEES